MRTPPHLFLVNKPSNVDSLTRTCHGQSPNAVSRPPTMRPSRIGRTPQSSLKSHAGVVVVVVVVVVGLVVVVVVVVGFVVVVVVGVVDVVVGVVDVVVPVVVVIFRVVVVVEVVVFGTFSSLMATFFKATMVLLLALEAEAGVVTSLSSEVSAGTVVRLSSNEGNFGSNFSITESIIEFIILSI